MNGPRAFDTCGGLLVDRSCPHLGQVFFCDWREGAEHLCPEYFYVLHPESTNAARKPYRFDQPSLLPTSHRVLVNSKTPGYFSNLHQCHLPNLLGELRL